MHIDASDGRSITLSYLNYGYDDVVQSVSDGTRTWNCAYHAASPSLSLDSVTLPDGSVWNFSNFDAIPGKFKNWRQDVVAPAFATNELTIYKK